MLNESEIRSREMIEIKSKLSTIHNDIKRLMDNHNQQYLDLILANSKKDFINAIAEYVAQDIENGLEKGMVRECDIQDECRQKFTGFLQNNASLIKQDSVPEEIIISNQAELDEIREGAQYKRCDSCFLEVNVLFEKQINLMRSLRIYSTNNEKKQNISSICEESIVKGVLEPLSNKQRVQILKAIATETKTFSSLSKLTGLRGGNLLFHLQKLLDTDIIIQRHERGDYMITEKGYNLLMVLAEVNTVLEK